MTSPISPELVEAVTAEFDPAEDSWSDSLNMAFLLGAAQHFGALPALGLRQLLAVEPEDDEFLVTLQVSPRIVLSSEPVSWEQVRPAAGVAGSEAVEHVLRRLGELEFLLRYAFDQDAVLLAAEGDGAQPDAMAE